MDNLIIEKTDVTPYVSIETEVGKIEIEGICTPENSIGFFEPIKASVKGLIENNKRVGFEMNLQYFNTSASKSILDLLLIVARSQKECKVVWKIQEGDEELRESGEVMEEITGLDFEYFEYFECFEVAD
jgi:hypothetical protein